MAPRANKINIKLMAIPSILPRGTLTLRDLCTTQTWLEVLLMANLEVGAYVRKFKRIQNCYCARLVRAFENVESNRPQRPNPQSAEANRPRRPSHQNADSDSDGESVSTSAEDSNEELRRDNIPVDDIQPTVMRRFSRVRNDTLLRVRHEYRRIERSDRLWDRVGNRCPRTLNLLKRLFSN